MIGGSAKSASAIRVARPPGRRARTAAVPGQSAVTSSGEHGERRDRPADVGDVDGEEAAAAEVAEPERERQPDHHGDAERGDGEQQLLEQQLEHAAVAGPVGRRW